MKRNRIIVLTGGIGSGKSLAARILSERFRVLSADEVSREIIERPEIRAEIKARLTDRFFGETGLDRKAFGRWVFSSEARTATLNEIMHPAVCEELLSRARATEGTVFVEIPLFFEAGGRFPCEEVWVISADRETRIARTMARDGLSREEIEARMNRQIAIENLSSAYTVIENNGSAEDLRRRLSAELARIGEQ